MAYTKQNFNDGQVLTAAHLNHIESGLVALNEAIKDLGHTGINMPLIRYVDLKASKWVGESSPYSQVVTINGVTANSQVDLTPNAEQLAVFYQKDLAFVTENDNGLVTVFAIGQKPENDYTIQVTITEVDV